MRRAVFLDRDGVVNRAVLRQGKPYPPATLSDLRLLPGVREACRQLREAGFALILITNQPDIARGMVSARASLGNEPAPAAFSAIGRRRRLPAR